MGSKRDINNPRTLTHCGNNLCLETELVLKTTGKIGKATLAITGDIWNLADVIEHMARGEEQDGNKGEGGPEVSVLEDREDIGTSNSSKSDEAENGDSGDDELHPVEGTLEGWGWGRGEMTGDPGMDGFCAVHTGRGVC